ncbi:hypothetical protein [Engelhardtia mirabilis]|uniref:Rdx family protein n=1 Tax=Engelhardtia mirabilis TaxID=2528011 RepID=A0A518BP30_9BACT|nr:hypothetical protein Pla133_38340 [Planctomycetes bacterium Pla133]QDV03058.1 hypothetical protein Pla86_38330 [Planctomycetes bacterium Pla86]
MGQDVTLEPGRRGQFDLTADGELISTRGGNWLTRPFGAGYPDEEELIARLRELLDP